MDDLLPADHEVLRCYSLPLLQAIPLLELLRAEGVDAASLFPGFAGPAARVHDVLNMDSVERRAPTLSNTLRRVVTTIYPDPSDDVTITTGSGA